MASGSTHTVWAFGHVVTLAAFTRIVIAYTIQIFSKGSAPNWWYKLAYAGALLSYSIVVLNTQGVPQLSTAYAQRALMDDNVQYAILVVYWFFSKPVYFSLIPFATFSLFHVLTFARTTVIPKLQPPRPAGSTTTPTSSTRTPGSTSSNAAQANVNAAAGQAATTASTGLDRLAKTIQVTVKNNYDKAMRFVAFTEMGIFVWVCLRAITFRGSKLAPLFLAQFIRLRYTSSPFTREAFSTVTARVDNIVAKQSPTVQDVWGNAKRLVASYAGAVQGQPGAGAQPAAAGVRR